MNAPAKIAALPPVTKINIKHGKRIEEISLAACALFGLIHHRGPVCHDHQALVMGHLDACFGFTPAESERASDMLFEATLNHSITDFDRPRIEACATELTRIASTYRGSEEQDREVYAAGYELFEIESLWEASRDPEADWREWDLG